MLRLAAALTALGLTMAHHPTGIGPGTSPVVIHLSISGGWSYEGVLWSKPGVPDTACSITRYVQATGPHAGRLLYSAFTVNYHKFNPHTIHKQFALTVLNYHPGIGRYSAPRDTLIDLSVRNHTYYGARSTDPAYRIAVQLGRTPLTGTFWATHVGTTDLTGKWPSVTIKGAWVCTGIAGRTIQVM